MAGIAALYTPSYNSNSPWYICPNGEIIEPLDLLHTLFPNEGRKIVGDNVCFVARKFSFPILENLLPPATSYYTPGDFVDGVISLLVMSTIVTILIIFSEKLWTLLDPNFRSINPPHKKLYVLANLAKAILLGILALSPRYWAGSFRFYSDKFQGVEIKRCGIIYIVTDFVALFLVPKLPRSTLLHHITTSVMAIVVTSVELQMPGWNGFLGVAKMGILYGLFSSAAFPVNIYLALRVVYPNAKWMPVLVHVSLWTYILCCILNWSIHAVWVFRLVSQWQFSVIPLFYLGAVCFMVNDDIILLSWLVKRLRQKPPSIVKKVHENGGSKESKTEE